MSDIAIRSAERRDADGVLCLWRDAGVPVGVSDNRAGILRLLDSDPQALLLAVCQEQLVGSLIAVFDGWRASFYRLAVSPEHRRRGVASALVTEAEWRLRQRGAQRLTAIVADGDPRAVGFWQAAGYVCQSDRVRFIKQPA